MNRAQLIQGLSSDVKLIFPSAGMRSHCWERPPRLRAEGAEWTGWDQGEDLGSSPQEGLKTELFTKRGQKLRDQEARSGRAKQQFSVTSRALEELMTWLGGLGGGRELCSQETSPFSGKLGNLYLLSCQPGVAGRVSVAQMGRMGGGGAGWSSHQKDTKQPVSLGAVNWPMCFLPARASEPLGRGPAPMPHSDPTQ